MKREVLSKLFYAKFEFLVQQEVKSRVAPVPTIDNTEVGIYR